MKKFYSSAIAMVFLLFAIQNLIAQKTSEDSLQMLMDSLERYFTYEKGKIDLSGGIASLTVPTGFGFLNGEKSQKLLTDIWGNMPDESVLGMLFPENLTPLDSNAWGFVVSYDEMGYVKDDDAKDINYDDLLKTMKDDTNEGNKEREKMGYGKVELVGWGSQPYYDANKKVLHWAKELKFDGGVENTLNYDLRILGRKGVLSMNAVGGISQLAEIKRDIPKIMDAASFNSGYTYKEFDSKLDEVAAVSIGGLVAGKVLAKTGLLAIIAKFGKVIILGAVAAGAWLINLFRRRKNSDEDESEIASNQPNENIEEQSSISNEVNNEINEVSDRNSINENDADPDKIDENKVSEK